MDFFYCFTVTLFHSLWQAGLLALVYAGLSYGLPRAHPLHKRNQLYGLLLLQLLFSALTFIVISNGISAGTTVDILRAGTLSGFFADYSEYIFYGYAVVLVWKAGLTSRQWLRFKKECRNSLLRPAAELKIFTRLKAHHLGIRRDVKLWYSRQIKVPLTFGFLKPVILLPFSLLNNISTAEIEAIILHELAHIKNRDYLLNWLLVVAEMFYFFNPFIKLIATDIRLEREKSCDVQVIDFEYSRLFYAETLLKIARNGSHVSPMHLGAVKKTPELLKRIAFFTDERNARFRKNKTGFSMLIPFVALLAASIFLLPSAKKSSFSQNAEAASTVASVTNSVTTIETTGIQTAENLYPIEINPSSVYEFPGANGEFPAEPLPEKSGENVPEEAEVFDEAGFALPAAMNATPDSSKEFIYTIETPQGKITQSFRLTNIKGRWVLQPQWMLTETTPDTAFMMKPVIMMDTDSIQ